MAAADELRRDRVGIGWRPELALGIWSHLDRIDVVELIADDLFGAPSRELAAFRTLAAQVPIVLHGVSLGLASSVPVEAGRLDRMARVVGGLEPEFWSEHLAFVRGAGVEIGHLAAPPRTEATLEGTATNVERAAKVVGAKPRLENVATLIDPPGSTWSEPRWITSTLAEAGAELLLDLNNLYSNAVNFGRDPVEMLGEFPLERVGAVHIAGGKWIASSSGVPRLLDDHLHDVPELVFDLLTEVGARTSRGVTVILERDGAYPPFDDLAKQLDRAREALARGRERTRVSPKSFETSRSGGQSQGAPELEAYLARLYVDAEARARFLAAPQEEASRAGLDDRAQEALANIDRTGLELAVRSFAKKRARRPSTR